MRASSSFEWVKTAAVKIDFQGKKTSGALYRMVHAETHEHNGVIVKMLLATPDFPTLTSQNVKKKRVSCFDFLVPVCVRLNLAFACCQDEMLAVSVSAKAAYHIYIQTEGVISRLCYMPLNGEVAGNSSLRQRVPTFVTVKNPGYLWQGIAALQQW